LIFIAVKTKRDSRSASLSFASISGASSLLMKLDFFPAPAASRTCAKSLRSIISWRSVKIWCLRDTKWSAQSLCPRTKEALYSIIKAAEINSAQHIVMTRCITSIHAVLTFLEFSACFLFMFIKITLKYLLHEYPLKYLYTSRGEADELNSRYKKCHLSRTLI